MRSAVDRGGTGLRIASSRVHAADDRVVLLEYLNTSARSGDSGGFILPC